MSRAFGCLAPSIPWWVLLFLFVQGCHCGRSRPHRKANPTHKSLSPDATRTLVLRGSGEIPALSARTSRILETHIGNIRVIEKPNENFNQGFGQLKAGAPDLALGSLLSQPSVGPKTSAAHLLVPLGYVPIAVVVHEKNPLDRITLPELQDILAGRIQSWKEPLRRIQEAVRADREERQRLWRKRFHQNPEAPATKQGIDVLWERRQNTALAVMAIDLVPYVLEEPSSVTALLVTELLKGKALDVRVRTVDSFRTILESARRVPGSIAFLPLPLLYPRGHLAPGIKILGISRTHKTASFLPSERAALTSGDYPLRLPVGLFARSDAAPLARSAMQLLSSQPDRKLADLAALVPLGPEARKRLTGLP